MGSRFENLYPEDEHTVWDILRWKLGGIGAKLHPYAPPIALSENAPGPFSLTWIGHSSYFIRAGEYSFLVDPVFSEYCAPVNVRRLKRHAPPGLAMSVARQVPLVFITHNHYDHLDRSFIEILPADARYVLPKGLGKWFASLGRRNYVELGWWDSARVADAEVTCVPAQHFSARTPWDRNKSLWVGWVVRAGGKTIYLAGDTGYCPVFREIGAKLGPMDLATIPIGAYEPRWLMKPMHVNPEEAVQIHSEVRSKLSVAGHWGTFRLTDEPMDEPPKRLAKALESAGLRQSEFRVLAIGESIAF